MSTDKSPRSRFEVQGMDRGAEDKSEGAGESLASIAHNATLDEESNIPGTDAAPPAAQSPRVGTERSGR
jgi:hypothetical protein